jgi:nickel/cobalt transporter (NicO) family protein
MGRRRGRSPHTRTLVRAVLAAAVAAAIVPAVAFAHPLGNFTINHYAGLRVEPDRIVLDVVVDQAEIPTFQARLDLDTDGDGEVSDPEVDAGRKVLCEGLRPSLDLRVDGVAESLTLTEAGLAFPPGAGGLSTMRQVCGFVVALAAPLADGASVTFADASFAERLGWREIVASGSGVSLAAADGAALPASSVSSRLTSYPQELLTRPLAQASMALVVTPGGPTLPPLDIADAGPLDVVWTEPVPGQVGVASPAPDQPAVTPGPGTVADAVASPAPAPAASPAVAASVPGGVGAADLPAIFRSADLTPVVLIVSLLTAAALGAGHALTPGHGKTLMAAYLVGTRGRPLHALGLGLSVSVSHTVGILVLAALVVGAQGILAPDMVVRAAPVVAAISIVAIGGWMLVSEVRRRRGRRVLAASHAHDHAHLEAVDHGHAHDHSDAHEHAHPHAEDAHADEHDHVPSPHDDAGEHSHGGIRHSHLPAAGSTITWRSLFVLGLAGGLIPSTSALLILLGSIAAGRPAFGFVLVVAFGLGMAGVMAGIGLAMVFARGRLDRVGSGSPLGRVTAFVPLAAAVLVFGLGLYLTAQALGGTPTL